MKCNTNTKLITLFLSGGIAYRMVLLLKISWNDQRAPAVRTEAEADIKPDLNPTKVHFFSWCVVFS